MFRKLVFLLLISLSLSTLEQVQKPDPPLKLIAAELYYGRIPVEYWEHRIMTVKSMGFNAISFYIVWNYHEVRKGVFDYQNENKNLTLFLQLAKKYELYVLIRPGPFVCAQWDFGGLPARLLNVPDIKLRSFNTPFLDEVYIYFKSLAPVIEPFLEVNKGPIVYLQIENQYGYWGSDKDYIRTLRELWWGLDIKVDQYYADAANILANTFWEGANIAVNDGSTLGHYEEAMKLNSTGRVFGGQIYSGWFSHWGQRLMGMSVEEFERVFSFLFQSQISFSMYVAHGGTSFGLTAGANILFEADGKGDYWQGMTSYDYDAPINQQGSPTEKYQYFRSMAKRFVQWDIPQLPPSIPIIWIAPLYPVKVASLLANLPEPSVVQSERTYPFESDQLQMYNQGIGVYQTILQRGFYRFRMDIHDFAIVYLGRQMVTTFDRSESPFHLFNVTCTKQCKLTIIVQALGHLSFGYQMEQDFKGIVGIEDQKHRTFKWNIYCINIDENILQWENIGNKKVPSLFKVTFNLEAVGDTFINMKQYKKGYVWINGRNLGRYWDKGPQFKLFCPGVWLRQGENQLFILDLLTDEPGEITGDQNQWD